MNWKFGWIEAGSSPGLSGEFDAAEAASSSSDDTSSQELHELPPLNLDLVEDMKDILFRTSSISTSGPPAVDRSVIISSFYFFK